MKPMKKVVKFKKSMKHAINDKIFVRMVVDDIKEQVGEDDLPNYKYDQQMVIDVCNCAEKHSSKKKKKGQKMTKRDKVLKIFSELYEDIDLNLVDANIDTVLNNKLVKKYDLVNRMYRFVINFFLTK